MKQTPGHSLRFLLSKATPQSSIEMNVTAARHLLHVVDAMYEALESCEYEVDGREDINEDGGPNVFMRIGNVVRSALREAAS